ncbi:MAG: hypothetical protein E4H01_09195 [Lysobacterales bacterium]|nr:MAG: hypothetical protein E4H01_09195 [Xanthomonadales bacterium]
MKHGMTNAYRMGSGLGKSVDSTLRSMGPRGNQLANGVQKSMDDSDKVYAVITGKKDIALRGVTKAQHDAWVAAREAGQIAPGNINQTGIDALAHLYDNEIPDILRAAGITKLDGLTPGRYVSHHYNMDKMEAVVQKPEWLTLAQRQLGITYAKATELRDRLLEGARRSIASPITQVMRPSVDLHRTFDITIAQAKNLGLPIADNAFALDRYARQIADRVGFAKNFGADSERMKIMLNDLRKTVPSKIHMDVIEKSLRAVVGLDAEPGAVTQAFSWVTNNVLVPQTLALASISQAGQSTNTIAKVGGRHFLRGAKELRREARLFAGQGGQASQFYGTIKSILDSIDGAAGDFFTGVERSNGLFLPKAVGREGLGSRLNLGGFILSRTGFNGLDKFNRFAAAYSGKSWLESNVRDAVRGTLSPKRLSRTAAEFKKLGLNMREIVSRGVLTDEELVHGAMRISDITQFRIRPFDLPLYWSSPNAGVFRMLKTFTFNQGRFIKREIISPATRYFATNGHEGSMRPFAFFIAGYPAAGAAIGSIRGILKGKEPFEDQTPMEAYFSAHAWVGGFGMLQDVFKAASNGTRAMLSMGAGPALTFGADMVEAGARSAISGDPNHLGRFVTRHSLPGLSQDVGGLRTYLDEALFPKD